MNPIARQLARIDVHPDDREVLDRIAARFTNVDERGCMFISGAANGGGRPQIKWHGRDQSVARVIVALRDDNIIWESWKWHTTLSDVSAYGSK